MDNEFRYDSKDCLDTDITLYTDSSNRIYLHCEATRVEGDTIFLELTPVMAENLASALGTAINHIYRRKRQRREIGW